MEHPFVIAGAGIAGLTLAAALERLTDPPPYLLLDERPAIGSSGGSITLWPNAMAALDEIGVGDDVRRAGHPIGAGSVRTPAGRVLRSLDVERSTAVLGGPLVAVRRGVLVDLLHDRVRAGSVRLGTAVRGYDHAGDGVQVLTDGAPVVGQALVGADGYRSEVARALDPGLAETYAGYPAWRGIAGRGTPEGMELWGSHLEFGVVPLGDDATYWFATAAEPAGGAAADERAHLRTVFAGWPDVVRQMLDAPQLVDVTRNDVMDRALPRRWADGRVVVIGDAAHPMRPHLGQGGCQAITDAVVLASLVGSAPSLAAAFATFERQRRRPVGRIVAMSRSAGRAINGPTALHHLSRVVPDAVFLRTLARFASTDAGRRAVLAARAPS